MKKTFNKAILVGAIALASSQSFALETYNAKTTAMGGVGVASGDFASGTVMNPALAGKFESSDDFNVNFNMGLRASDKDKVIDSIDDFQMIYDQFEMNASNDLVGVEDVRGVRDALADLSGKTLDLGVGGGVTVSIPNNLVAASLVVNNYTKLGVGTLVSEDDLGAFDTAINAVENSDPNGLDALESYLNTGFQSEAVIGGYSVSEVGVALSREVAYGVYVGVTPKMQRMDVFTYSQAINDFDDAEFDQDQSTSNDTQMNYDVGVYRDFGLFQVGLSAVNLAGAEFELDHLGATVELDPTYTAGLAFENEWVKLGVDYELTKSQAFSMTTGVGEYQVFGESQFVRAGLEFDLFDNLQLRAGYQMDLEESVDNVASVGLGISPFDILNVDIAAVYGENDTYGFVTQFGFQF